MIFFRLFCIVFAAFLEPAATIYYAPSCFKVVPAFQEAMDEALRAVIKENTFCDCKLLNGNALDKVYKLQFDHEKPLVLRLNRRTPYATQRTVERSQMAASIGIAPKILYISPNKEVFLTTFTEGKTIVDFRDSQTLQKFVQAIKKFHVTYQKSSSFPLVYKIGERAKMRLEELEKYLQVPQDVLGPYYTLLKKFEDYHVGHDVPQPIHGDLNQGNILLAGDDVVLLDWGDSTTSDIFDDLGGVAHYFAMTEDQEKALLHFYFEGKVPPQALKRLHLKRLETLLHHAAWAYLSLLHFKKNKDENVTPLLSFSKGEIKERHPLTLWMKEHPQESFSIKTRERALEIGKKGFEEFWQRYQAMSGEDQ